jgi:hypothetical protein
MSTPRDVVDVVPTLLEIIPDDQTILRKAISDFADKLWNQAPELRMGLFWTDLAKILNNHVGELDADWKLQLVKVFNNKN